MTTANVANITIAVVVAVTGDEIVSEFESIMLEVLGLLVEKSERSGGYNRAGTDDDGDWVSVLAP